MGLHIRLLFGVLLLSVCGEGSAENTLKVSVGELPLTAGVGRQGGFFDLLDAMDEAYPEGVFEVNVYPMARSIHNVATGKADFHLPMVRSPFLDMSDKPFRLASEPMGKVCFSVFSHSESRISWQQLLDGADTVPFAYSIDVLRGSGEFLALPFPVIEMTTMEQSLKRVAGGRVDALVTATDEASYALSQLQLNNVKGELIDCWDDVIVIPNGIRGDDVDRIVSGALRKLKETGQLQVIYQKIHSSGQTPASEGQP